MREIPDAPELESIAGRYQTLRELVSRSLRAAILSGAAAAGQFLRERDVARRLGVSKTPVREAFRELEREGLVVSAPHRGVIVVGVTVDAVREMLELRLALEPFAARLAAERTPASEVPLVERLVDEIRAAEACVDPVPRRDAGERLHRKVYELCGNSRLQRLLIDALEYTAMRDAAGQTALDDVPAEHLAVAEAIVRRDAAAAERHMREHIRRLIPNSATPVAKETA